MDPSGIGRALLVLAAVIAIIGLVLVAVGRGLIPRLPGDIAIERRNVRFYVPLGTSILLSLVLTVLLNVFFRR